MAGVPDEAVAREVEGQVQRQAQLDDAEIAGEVGRANAKHAQQLLAHLLGELEQLGVAQAGQVRGRVNRRQDGSGHIQTLSDFRSSNDASVYSSTTQNRYRGAGFQPAEERQAGSL